MTDRLIDWLIDWAIHSLSHPLIDWLMDWFIGWLIDWLVDWLIPRCAFDLINWFSWNIFQLFFFRNLSKLWMKAGLLSFNQVCGIWWAVWCAVVVEKSPGSADRCHVSGGIYRSSTPSHRTKDAHFQRTRMEGHLRTIREDLQESFHHSFGRKNRPGTNNFGTTPHRILLFPTPVDQNFQRIQHYSSDKSSLRL